MASSRNTLGILKTWPSLAAPKLSTATTATNPAYCGRYTGLRTRKVEPKHRYKETYGKTGTAHRPVEEHVVLNGLIVEPIITQKDFDAVQERRTANKALGGKRVVRYLLRGMVLRSPGRRRSIRC